MNKDQRPPVVLKPTYPVGRDSTRLIMRMASLEILTSTALRGRHAKVIIYQYIRKIIWRLLIL